LICETIPGLQYAVKWKRAYYGLPELGWTIEMVACRVEMSATTRRRDVGFYARRRHPALERRSLEAGAVSELLGIARFRFHGGKVEEFKHLSAQAMEMARTRDTGALQYDIYFNDDQSECIVLERFRDSEALIEHAANLGDLFGAILATGSVLHGELLGEPSAD
jgi:quinol monooxygenase YgiN